MQNILKYIQEMEAVGFSRPQAETHINFLDHLMKDKYSTNNDIARIEKRMEGVEKRIERLEEKVTQLEYKLTLKLGALIIAANSLAGFL